MSDLSSQYRRLIEKAWADDGFKQRLLADPATVLKAEGFALPAGAAVRVVENTASQVTLVIPRKPAVLDDEALAAVAGGLSIKPPSLLS